MPRQIEAERRLFFLQTLLVRPRRLVDEFVLLQRRVAHVEEARLHGVGGGLFGGFHRERH